MPSGGQIGSGIKAGYSTSSPTSWTEIPQILEGTPFQVERDRVETTIHGTTSYRTYIPGLAEVSDCELVLLADLENAVHLELSDLEQAQTTIWFRYEIPITATLASTNYYVQEMQVRVGKFQVETPIDDRKVINVSFQYQSDFTIYESVASAF